MEVETVYDPTVELVVYWLRQGAGRDAFRQANELADRFLARQPGFLARQLAAGPDGTWADIVWWSDRSAAEAAAAAFTTAPEAAGVMGLIDPDGMELRHLDLVRSTGSPAAPS